MWRRIALAVVVPLLGAPAQADSPIAEIVCGPRDVIVQRLEAGMGAALAGTGLRDMETVMEVWAAPSGDWTLVQSYANGESCILAMGQVWESVVPPPA